MIDKKSENKKSNDSNVSNKIDKSENKLNLNKKIWCLV